MGHPQTLIYSTVTDANGETSVTYGALKGSTTKITATANGVVKQSDERVFVNAPDDFTANVLFWDAPTPVTEPGPHGPVLNTDNLYEFPLELPEISGPAVQLGGFAWLYFIGGGNHVAGQWDPTQVPAVLPKAPIGLLYNEPNPLKAQDGDDYPHNTAFLYVQTRDGTVSMSHNTSWGTKGEILNRPDPDIDRVQDFPDFFVSPENGEWINAQDNINPYGGLKLNITGAFPSTLPTGGTIRFNGYFNGYNAQGGPVSNTVRAPLPDFPVIPADGGPPYQVLMPAKHCLGYGQRPETAYVYSYIEYYWVPSGGEDDPTTWLYGPYHTYKMATIY